MMALEFFRWWYGRGWLQALARLGSKLRGIERTFSVGLLLRTLFSPWRRIISYPGSSLAEHFRAMLDNLVSRFVGFWVRIVVLIAAAIVSLGFGLIACALTVLWPLLPPAALSLIIWGIVA